jgi:hypothetical protein
MSITQVFESAGARRARPLAIILFLVAASASALATETKSCIPTFPFVQGWWGADAAYSIPFPDGRSVWIFGDTLYGKDRFVEGNNPRMVRNSIGISTCDAAGNWKLDYIIRKDEAGQPRDFFQARDKSYWYWALDGFLHRDNLWVTLVCIRDKPVETSAALAFETCGTDLAKVSNLSAPAPQWKVEILPLVPDGAKAYPSATAVVEGDYAYIFAVYEKDPRPMLLVRIPLDSLKAPKENLQYLADDGTWKPGFDPAHAKPVMVPGSSEMSVRYHTDLKKWVAVMNEPRFPSHKVVVRTAPKLTGPWTEGKVIYQIPDMQPSAPAYDRDTFCYAAKEHPEFEKPGQLLFTYVCNTLAVPKIVTNTTIYFPKTVIVPMPTDE